MTYESERRCIIDTCLTMCDLGFFIGTWGNVSMRVGEHILLHHDNVKAANTEDAPYTVYPTQGPGGMVDGEKATLRIPALSWNVIRFVPVEK